ncbi:MAG: tetratricopeptide repeat protein [Anaerolineales bacterium]|nr:MAG: tetratricopeptide repeat protein [Anaerolineales bacterium]
MNTDSLKKLRIFAASPRDVANERARLATVVEDLKALAEHVGVTLELVDWRQVVAGLGRPEQIILDQLKPDTWDLFIGILWHRFGTLPGGKDPQTQKEYLSGTEEEFRVAYRLWQQHKRPRVMFYWCKRSIPPDDLDPAQFQRVKEFFTGFTPDADHPGLYRTFDSIESFERLVRQNLTTFLLDYSEQVKQRVVSPQEVQVFAPRVPDNLPRRAAFFGRNREMDRVLGALGPEERGWGVVIDGIGGIGKTALAVEAAYRCKEGDLFDAFIFVSAKQKRLEPSGIRAEARAATTLDEFVNETARTLGKPGITQLTGEDRRRALLDTLQTTRALIIYDNLETLTKEEQEALADWLRFLPQGNKAMLTSRRRGGEGALWLRLEKLDWETAREIIAHQAERDARLKGKLQRVQGRWQELHDATGGSPLALVHTLGLMRVRVTLSFDGALAMLRRGAARESPLQEFVYQEARQELGTSDVAALSALSFFVPSATFEVLMAVADLSRTALETVLERLDALSLVNKELGEERYSLHPLTRAYVRDELLADADAAGETGMRFARFWLDYAKRYGGEGKESYKTYDRLEAEWANLEAAANWLWEMAAVRGETVGDKDAARMLVDLAHALSRFLWFGGRWDERVQLSAWAYEAARALQDWSKAGWRAYQAAWIHCHRARTDDAALWADRCAEAWARGGSKREQATATRTRGLVARQREDYDEAERLYQDALAVWRDLGLDADVANGLFDLGELAHERQDYDAAERYYREALELLRKIDDKGNQADSMGNLGQLALDREQWAEARQWFEQALSLAREVGRVEIIAQAQYGLARVWEAEGRADLALPLAQEALEIYERLQSRGLAEARELVERLRGRQPPP